MPRIAAAVCDTPALLFHAGGDRRLGSRAAALFAACEARDAVIYVPVVVLWEIGALARLGRIDLGRSLAAFAQDLFSNPAYHPLDLSLEQVLLAAEQGPHDDPFDALIIAAAHILELPLVTGDRKIADESSVRTIW